MECPKCGSEDVVVVGTDWKKRKRIGCRACDKTSYKPEVEDEAL